MGKRAYSPREISNQTYKVLEWGDPWASAFGKPCVNDPWFICGRSASGKSSFVMQLAKELCKYGRVLYVSYEEGVNRTMQERIRRFRMQEVQGRFRVVVDESMEDLKERLSRRQAPHFVIVDSIQLSGWNYSDIEKLVKEFPRRCFIFVSQEHKGEPLGKTPAKTRYLAGVKVWVSGYIATCQGRYSKDASNQYVVWEEGVLRTRNGLGG